MGLDMDDKEESPRSTGGGSGGPKRGHRTACNSCKRMKVKCEWDQESVCNRCLKHQTECIFTIPERKKREKKETYLTSLEDRLNRMEAVMAQSGLSLPGKEEKNKLMTPSTVTGDAGLQDIPDRLSVLKVFDDGTLLYIGAASGFSIFGTQGLNWVTQVTGSNEFANHIMNFPSPRKHLQTIGAEIWSKLPDDLHTPLPSKEVALSYIDEFFKGFNLIFPLFSKPVFMERFNRSYPVTASQNPAWYACLNLAFTFGSEGIETKEHRAQSQSQSPCSSGSSPRSLYPDEADWWKWFRNASSTYIDLQFREGSMLAVQAMIGMAFILQILPTPHPCSVLSASALRLAQAIGLHRNVTDASLTPELIEERRNVFWTGVIVERAMLLRSGRPSVIQEDDIGIDLPKPPTSTTPGKPLPSIRYMSTLALLQGRIYNKLYSAKATTRSTLERLQWVSTLDEELQEWKDGLPIEIRPGNEISAPDDPDFMVPVLMMQFGYFTALSTIHRCSVHYEAWSNDSGEPPLSPEKMSKMKLNPRVFSSAAITLGSARSVIALLKNNIDCISMKDVNILRMLEYYPLSACLILFASVLQNPRDSQAMSDVSLMKDAVAFLSQGVDENENLHTTVVIRTFKVVADLADKFVKKSQAEGVPHPKRGRGNEVEGKVGRRSLDGDLMDQQMDQPPMSETDFRNSMSSSIASSMTNSTPIYPASAPTINTSLPTYSVQTSQPQPPNQNFLPQSLYSETTTTANNPPNLYSQTSDPLNLAGLDGIDSTLQTSNMDFFPNDILMPTDGSWFFPLANINPNPAPGSGIFTGGLGTGMNGGVGDGLGAGVGLESEGGFSRENWINTAGMGMGWSMGGGQNVDWGFGGNQGLGNEEHGREGSI